MGMVISSRWYEPKTNSTNDINAAWRAWDFQFGWLAHPIYSEDGDYPLVMRERIANLSQHGNFPTSRLPKFSKEEVDFIKGTWDFLGINHYTTSLISEPGRDIGSNPSFLRDLSVIDEFHPSWPKSEVFWLREVPWGFYKLLMAIKEKYNNPLVYITENGVPEKALQDNNRLRYLKSYTDNLSKAIKQGCNVKGYFIWSLMDNYEWAFGYTQKFGLYYVNFSDPARPRVPRASAKWYQQLIKDHRDRHGYFVPQV